MDKIRVGMIGLGQRGFSLLDDIILKNKKADVVAICDSYDDRVQKARESIKNQRGHDAFCSREYMDIINRNDVDFVVVTSSWETHIPIALCAMQAGKPVAVEVGGAYSIEQCWDLVKCYEQTQTPFTMLENCCYGKRELMIKNMVDLGIFGEIVHCDGGYMHDLREEVAFGKENRHYRLRNYIYKNCENYPTHELGPIAKILGINHKNRMLSLTSTASKSAGLKQYIKDNKSDDADLMNTDFCQGDIITTVIKCALGQTIHLTLDTTLPRPYSRGLTVHGTKAMYEEATDSFFIDNEIKDEKLHFHWKEEWDNAQKYEDKFLDPMWKQYLEEGLQGSHGGMDWLQFDKIFDALLKEEPFYVDVYDTASWMCISALSEKSIALGSMPVEIPDFTNGKWIMR